LFNFNAILNIVKIDFGSEFLAWTSSHTALEILKVSRKSETASEGTPLVKKNMGKK